MGCRTTSIISSTEGLHLANKNLQIIGTEQTWKKLISRVGHWYCEKQSGVKKMKI